MAGHQSGHRISLFLRLLIAAFLLFAIQPLGATDLDDARKDAVSKAVQSLRDSISSDPDKFQSVGRVAILPIQRDMDDRVTELVINEVTKTSLNVIERRREEIARLLAEYQFVSRVELRFRIGSFCFCGEKIEAFFILFL